MGTWIIPTDLLAESRFLVSPLHETVAALTVLSRTDADRTPWQRSFRAAYLEAYRDLLASDPMLRALDATLWRPRRGDRPGWMADFITPPPLGDEAGFEDELAQVRAWEEPRMRAELRDVAGDLPAALERSGIRDAVSDLLRWIWTATVQGDWPRRRRVLEADIVSRASQLASEGWAGVFATLGTKQKKWLGDGTLQVNGYDLPARDLSDAHELSFVPVHSDGSWLAWDLPQRYAIIYPVAGALAATGSESTDPAKALARLIGTNRAGVLALLDSPRSTTQLAALTHLPVGAVGNHLRVLLDAGVVMRRRAGREVLYWRTALGDELVV
ncbi:ArsR family transcriptional regulator [Nocardioides sp. NPDC059952]|uniref:helix-turn-helix domain-containing protein n=1 Tax=Nocardioides sp. NPDC059952 TaxID=3347014 RepID=UPI00364E559B